MNFGTSWTYGNVSRAIFECTTYFGPHGTSDDMQPDKGRLQVGGPAGVDPRMFWTRVFDGQG